MSERVKELVEQFFADDENSDVSAEAQRGILERFADWLEEKGEI